MAGANVFKVPVLKILVENETLLISRDAKQEICMVSREPLLRNINSELIKNNSRIRLKSTIETKDDINITALKRSMECKEICKIYTMVHFCTNSKPNAEKYVEDSLETEDGNTKYRPILEMVLTNFSCKATNDGEQIWKLEFEEP